VTKTTLPSKSIIPPQAAIAMAVHRFPATETMFERIILGFGLGAKAATMMRAHHGLRIAATT
jgi:hypothetical protein